MLVQWLRSLKRAKTEEWSETQSQNYCHQLGETRILPENVTGASHHVVAHFLLVTETLG